jgi:hypothetical protein
MTADPGDRLAPRVADVATPSCRCRDSRHWRARRASGTHQQQGLVYEADRRVVIGRPAAATLAGLWRAAAGDRVPDQGEGGR